MKTTVTLLGNDLVHRRAVDLSQRLSAEILEDEETQVSETGPTRTAFSLGPCMQRRERAIVLYSF